mmetsp:Transcript_44381/g.105797  ORF Transcript_44381/g.105797 Transcript_44381/m.105797 type:complete len:335 (+) Transcript_44381:2197-3201(+)
MAWSKVWSSWTRRSLPPVSYSKTTSFLNSFFSFFSTSSNASFHCTVTSLATSFPLIPSMHLSMIEGPSSSPFDFRTSCCARMSCPASSSSSVLPHQLNIFEEDFSTVSVVVFTMFASVSCVASNASPTCSSRSMILLTSCRCHAKSSLSVVTDTPFPALIPVSPPCQSSSPSAAGIPTITTSALTSIFEAPPVIAPFAAPLATILAADAPQERLSALGVALQIVLPLLRLASILPSLPAAPDCVESQASLARAQLGLSEPGDQDAVHARRISPPLSGTAPGIAWLSEERALPTQLETESIKRECRESLWGKRRWLPELSRDQSSSCTVALTQRN